MFPFVKKELPLMIDEEMRRRLECLIGFPFRVVDSRRLPPAGGGARRHISVKLPRPGLTVQR